MKNAVIVLKFRLFLRNLNFCSDFSVMSENGLIRKLRLIQICMMSQTGKQIMTIRILASISRSKSNQSMKCFQKPCRKWGRETSSRPVFLFSKKLYIRSKREFSTFGRPPLGHALKTNYFRQFQRYAQALSFIKGSGTSFPITFCTRIFYKNISNVIFRYLTKFQCLYFSR